jgi:ribosomal protein L32
MAKPKLTPYNLRMANYTTAKPIGMIHSWHSICKYFYYIAKQFGRFELFHVTRTTIVEGC